MTSNLDHIRVLEQYVNNNCARKNYICDYLTSLDIPFTIQPYQTGQNVVATIGGPPYVYVGSHFDAVPDSPGANDNASAVSVTLSLLERYIQSFPDHVGLKGLFFDEEERGLLGSTAYVQNNDLFDCIGLYNLELVGCGDRIALWSVHENDSSFLLNMLCDKANQLDVSLSRFTNILNGADHMSFVKAGVDAFTLTAITEHDLSAAKAYYEAIRRETSNSDLYDILHSAPLFTHYHKSSDLSVHLHEKDLQQVGDLLYASICSIEVN